MAAPSVTYTFSNSTTADATEVNQNFTDIINGITDGTKDLTINLLTVNGAASFNGNVTLGNATGDDVTVTGRVASDVIPKTAANNTLGNATLTWQSLYLNNATTDGGAIYFDGTSTKFIKSDASGADLDLGGFTGFDLTAGCSIKTFGRYLEAKSANYTLTDTDGVSVIAMTTGASDRTVTLPTASANTGRVITVKKVDSGAGRVLLSEEGSDAIDGFSTVVAPLQYDHVTVVCTGSTWHVIDRREVSAWTDYTPTFSTSMDSPTNLDFQYRRIGNGIEVKGSLTSGTTPTGGLAEIYLPLSLTVVATSSIATLAGLAGGDLTTNQVFYTLATDGDSFMEIGRIIPGATTGALQPQAANAWTVIGGDYAITFASGISEWSDIA